MRHDTARHTRLNWVSCRQYTEQPCHNKPPPSCACWQPPAAQHPPGQVGNKLEGPGGEHAAVLWRYRGADAHAPNHLRLHGCWLGPAPHRRQPQTVRQVLAWGGGGRRRQRQAPQLCAPRCHPTTAARLHSLSNCAHRLTHLCSESSSDTTCRHGISPREGGIRPHDAGFGLRHGPWAPLHRAFPAKWRACETQIPPTLLLPRGGDTLLHNEQAL